MHDLAPHNANDTIYLLDYLEIILKYKRMIIRTTLASFLVSIVIALLVPRIYSSTAMILPPQQDSLNIGMMGLITGSGGTGMTGLAGDLLGKGSPVNLYVKILESETICDAIIDRFNFLKEEKIKYRTIAYHKLHKKVQIEADKKAGIISITVDDKDPKRAADIANAYVDEIGEFSVRLNRTSVSSNRVYLEERLAKVKSDFEKAADALKTFQIKNKTLDVTEQAKGTVRGVAELEGQLAAEEVRLSGMRRVFTDASQEVKNQQTVVANIRAQIAKFEGNKQGGSLPSIVSVPAMGQDYLRLMREFKIQETLFELLTKQYELAKLNEAKDDSSVQVIQKARVSDKSIKPSRRMFVMMVTGVTFVFMVILALALEYFNQMESGQRQRCLGLYKKLVAFKREV